MTTQNHKPRNLRKVSQLGLQIYPMAPTGGKVTYSTQRQAHRLLTDSTVQKIKQDLIRKAKVKKVYSKLKEREGVHNTKPSIYPSTPPPEETPTSLELHPERQAMLDEPEPTPREHQQDPQQQQQQQQPPPPRRRKPPKPVPFRKEALRAQQRREEKEKRRKEIEEGNRQRQEKADERERFRKAMAKASSGARDGQRKLGRESKVLLEKVQRMVGP